MSLAFVAAAVLFLPLFVFLPKLIQRGIKVDTDAAIDAFGKNELVKKCSGRCSSRWWAGAGPRGCWTRRQLIRLLG